MKIWKYFEGYVYNIGISEFCHDIWVFVPLD